MKKLFTGIIVLFLASSFVGIRAQGTGSASTLITVNIVPGVGVNTISDPDFGSVARNSGVYTLHTADDSAGRFLITGAENAEIAIGFSAPSQLVGSSDQTIPFTPLLAYTDSPASGNFIEIDPYAPPHLRLVKNSTDTSTGSLYISISGSIDVGNIPDGHYTGTITL
ncbi:MAG: hypothetical protein EA364_04685, partial [Balneolaceae bacterium]